jgi:isopenicillin-N N-acyltransferase-like protein
MTVRRFTSSELDPRVRGSAFGRACRAEIAWVFARYDELFAASGALPGEVRAWGERALRVAGDWCPRLADEMGGVAEGSGLATWQIGALNARTEIFAACAPRSAEVSGVSGVSRVSGVECSTSVHLPPGGGPPRTVQTWDWHDRLRDGMLALAYEARPGHQVRTFTEFGILAKIGLNERGIGVHFNILSHAADNDDIGVPVHLVARRILDEAGTIDDARAIAGSARTSASTAITVVGFEAGRADAVCLELSPAGLGEIHPDPDGALLHTNHFLDARLARDERLPDADDSRSRLALLRERRPSLRALDLTDRSLAMLSHAENGAAICAHPAPGATPTTERWETLITISLDLKTKHIHFHEGGPCSVTPATWQSL